MPPTASIPCPGCGAPFPDVDGPTHRYIGASPGCWALYGEVLARVYSDARLGSVGQMIVDAYAAQHPGTPSPQSIQSVTVHLLSLHAVLERGCPPEQARDVVLRAAERKSVYTWLEPPPSPGAVTVLDVHGAESPDEFVARAWDWGRSVWDAWAPHHATIRRWAALG